MEFDNFDIDDEGFIYTVTGSKSATTDIFKKMNPAGENILINLGYSDYTYGDMASYYYKNQTYGSQITDVDVDEDGTIRLLDFAKDVSLNTQTNATCCSSTAAATRRVCSQM